MDLSLLGDGSGPLPFDCSTPKTQRLKFTCHVCKKEYVSKFYFEKHIRTHPDQVPISHNVSNAVHLDESELSFSQLRDINDNTVSFRVPTARPPAKRKLNVAKNQAKNSSDKAKKVKPQLICTYCLKGYVCRRSFKTHMMTHTLQEAAARFPDIEDIIANSDEIAKESLTDVANSASFGECGAKFKQVVGHVVSVLGDEEWKEFSAQVCADLVKVIADKKCLLPSSLVNTLIAQLEEMLTNIELCDGYLKGLQLLDLFERDVLSQFILEFLLNFNVNVIKFITKTFRNNLPRRQQQPPGGKEPDKEDRQVIYYIAGSIMRGYLKIAKRSNKSQTWQSVASVLRTKVLIDKPDGDFDPDSEWTKEVDRGGLLYINSQCQSFFVKLTKVIFACEKSDGSINYDEVIARVSNSDLSVEWDSVISDALPESVSVGLMNDVVLCLCRTCGRGFAKRRLNFVRKKPVVSMPTRHLVASRKNR